jgi:histidinol-phosphate aminotransferase
MKCVRVREGVQKLVPYDPGKPVEELQREMGLERVIKLASNENALGSSPKATKALEKAIYQVHRYPDGSCYYLKNKAARKLGVMPQNLIFGNGSNEIIELLMRTYLSPGDKVVYGEPAFIVYKLISLAMDLEGVGVPLKGFTHDLKAMAGAVDERTKMVFVANPNNPTGTMVNQGDVITFLEEIPPEVIVVFDEAYKSRTI